MWKEREGCPSSPGSGDSRDPGEHTPLPIRHGFSLRSKFFDIQRPRVREEVTFGSEFTMQMGSMEYLPGRLLSFSRSF